MSDTHKDKPDFWSKTRSTRKMGKRAGSILVPACCNGSRYCCGPAPGDESRKIMRARKRAERQKMKLDIQKEME